MGARARGCWAVVAVLTVLSGIPLAATLKERARFRDGPSVTSAQLGVVGPGTDVEVLDDDRGWKRIRTPDGRVGYIWGEHLADPAVETSGRGREATGGGDLASAVAALRDDVQALRDRPEPATAADLERVRSEVDRLVVAQRELVRRLDGSMGGGAIPVASPTDASRTLIPIVFVIGAAMGWVGSRLAQRRRDRRQRHRLRL
jgi:Bacterial SH3 domain